MTCSTATGAFATVSDETFGLLFFGDFSDRQRCAPLLTTLLEIYIHLKPRSLHTFDSSSATALPEVVFPPGYIMGVSESMMAVYAQMHSLLVGGLPVVIMGETGVGKEPVARSLHLSSPRRSKPFVAVNCAAIPAELLEAELFGIGDRVATGVDARLGVFREAAGGTLFLDEIGEMPGKLQVKLLRVLEEKQLRPLGGAPVNIDVRIVAATNANLEARIERREFRRDLFFRLAGFVLRVPPLRQRREDIPPLVEGFLRLFSKEIGKPVRGISVRALRTLVERDWPGNVRELEHEVRRLVYICPPGQAIESSMLDGTTLATIGGSRKASGEKRAAPAREASTEPEETRADSWAQAVSQQPVLDLKHFEREMVREALRRAGRNQVRAAKLLGISRHGLRRKIDRYKLRELVR